MFGEITIINKTMELSDCKNAWFFDEKFRCWCLEDVLYTEKATTPKFQRLSIFVPEAYMSAPGEIDREGTMNGYTAETVPVIFENNSAGYMQMPHVWLEGPRCFAHQYLERGYVYVTAGNRGRESKDAKGDLCGKSPINLVDLKTAIRFLRHNAKVLPGDYSRIISVGWSAGGAMSTLLAVTGNNENYNAFLEENGAFMEESDAVYASQIYCPIVDLEHADLAYEWMFHMDKENEASPAGPAGVMSSFQEALSEKLKEKYITYFNSLKLVHPETKEELCFEKDGRSGSAYDYLMQKLNEAVTIFLNKLEMGELEEAYSAKDYLSGNYEYEKEVAMDATTDDEKPPMGEKMVPPSLGDLVSRPPKGMPFHDFKPPVMMTAGTEKSSWLTWDGKNAIVSDIDSYVLNHRRRMKPCTSFDTLAMDSGENCVFGTKEEPYMHFDTAIADAIEELKEEFPEEYEKYYASYAKAEGDKELEKRIYFINPFNFIGTEEKSAQASYYRIRVGARDADTSLSVSMTLALKLAQAGFPVDYQMVWDKPHCEADYPGEVCDWIEKICK